MSDSNSAIVTVSEAGTRFVTPEDTLFINETHVTFEDVVIQGGEIVTRAETTAIFKKLTHES
ncbi:MAG: hypothetical protein AAF725_15815 [Acidobacteriota bacterium]